MENLEVIVFRSTPIKVFILFVITFLSFSKIAYANLADEYFNKSVVFFSNGDIKKGSNWLKKAAEEGNNRYQYYLGNYYHNLKSNLEGLNEKENIKWRKEAFKWYLKSAKEQNDGRFKVALMYAEGRGVEQNYSEAIKWYKKEGGASSLNNIGVMYEHGTGVIQDNVTAHLYYNLSGAKGETKGRENRDRISKKMTREEIVEAQRLAREWMNKNENE